MKAYLNTVHLDKLLQSLGLKNDAELAQYLTISKQAVSAARHKEKVPSDWFIQAAMRGGISIDEIILNTAKIIKNEASDDPFISIPLVAAQLSAGCGSLETGGDIVETKDFRVSWLSRMGNPKKMVLMHVTGNSMEPYIHNADLTLICQDQTRIIPHKVYAVGIDEEIYIKELETLPGHRLVLRSYNKNYSPIEINMKGDLADSVRIIGRAVWWCHEA